MRKLTLLTLGLLALALAGSGAWAASIRIEPTTASVGVGDSFEVSVLADGVASPEEVLSFGFDVDFDPLAFDLTVAVWPGQTLSDPNALFSIGFFDDSATFPDVAGSWNGFLSLSPQLTLSGDDILLATLSFTAKQLGTFAIELTSSKTGQGLTTGTPLIPAPNISTADPVTPIAGTVSVTVSTVPEPGTLLLLGTGLAGVAGVGRRRRTHSAG